MEHLSAGDREFADADQETQLEERSADNRDLCSASDKETEGQSSDEAEFAILNHEDAAEDEKGDNSSDEKDFSIINGTSGEASADDADRDIANVGQEEDIANVGQREAHHEHLDVQRLIDMYGNINPTRQRRGTCWNWVKRFVLFCFGSTYLLCLSSCAA